MVMQHTRLRIPGMIDSGAQGAAIPGTIAGLKVWYSARLITGKSDLDTISQWNDLSGNDNHLVQASGGDQPVYHTGEKNGQPAVYFASKYMSFTSGITLNAHTVYAVLGTDAASNPVHYLTYYHNVTGTYKFGIYYGSQRTANANYEGWQCLVWQNSHLYHNATEVTYTDTGTPSGNQVFQYVGKRDDLIWPYYGYVCEFLIYDNQIAYSDIQILDAYFNAYYAIY